MAPAPIVKSTYWSDTCACSDIIPCVQHTVDPGSAPDRPTDQEMLERAYKQAAEKDAAWESTIKSFNLVTKLVKCSETLLETKGVAMTELAQKYEHILATLTQLAIYAVDEHSSGCKICGAMAPEGEHLYHSPDCDLYQS